MTAFLNLAISNLDKSKSLIPFFVKDSFDITGRTIMANKEGGKHEAREKFIEEAGTSLFWIGGIPAVRAIANKIYKKKIDSEIHFKRINSDGIQNYYADKLVETVKENGKNVTKNKFSKADLEGISLGGKQLGEIKEKLSRSGFIPNVAKGKYKDFHVGTSVAAVAINLIMLTLFLPMFNQFLSRKIISKEVNGKGKKINNTKDEIAFSSNNKPTFAQFLSKSQSGESCGSKNKQEAKNPSFGSLKDFVDFKNIFNFTQLAESGQLTPTTNMLLLDYGISGSRVTFVPRDNNERVEYIVKEGGIILFFYYAADLIKKGLSTLANKVFNIPIDLDYKVITDKKFLEKLKNPHKKEELLSFIGDKADELNVIKFIDKELAKAPKTAKHPKNEVFKNFTLQMAQKEGLIDVEFDSGLKKWIRHSKKYIETDKVIDLNNNLNNFYEKAFETKGMKIENIINKTKAVKAASVISNIAICCASLSYVIPKIQYMIREHRTQTNRAPGIKVYQEMAEKNMI